MRNLCIVQARMSSLRFPGKVLATLAGTPVIDILLNRISKSAEIDHIVVATSTHISDNILVEHLQGADIYRGSLIDVRSRFIEIANKYKPKNIIRITADCPLACPQLIDEVIALHNQSGADYSANCNLNPFPKGFDVEVFKSAVLHYPEYLSENVREKEHVTPWMYENGNIRVSNLEFNSNSHMNKFNFSVDNKNDLNFLEDLTKQAPIKKLTFWEIFKTVNFSAS